MQADCIPTTYYQDRHGYGQRRYNGKVEYHHRVSFVEANGLSLKDIEGKYILHSCDNPACVNPEHLRVGTAADNSADMVRRGRAGWDAKPGSKSPAAKLTEETVRAIRNERMTQVAIAKKYGVTQANVSSIQLRKTWKHI